MNCSKCGSEKVIINKFNYIFTDPKRFDIIVFEQKGKEHVYYNIKRVIGMPGERVTIIEGKVYVNEKPIEERNIYANRQTEIRINQEYFEKMGISMENEAENDTQEVKESPKVEVKVDLDADYFQWKEGKEIEERAKVSKERGERFQNMLKGFTSGKK